MIGMPAAEKLMKQNFVNDDDETSLHFYWLSISLIHFFFFHNCSHELFKRPITPDNRFWEWLYINFLLFFLTRPRGFSTNQEDQPIRFNLENITTTTTIVIQCLPAPLLSSLWEYTGQPNGDISAHVAGATFAFYWGNSFPIFRDSKLFGDWTLSLRQLFFVVITAN